MERLSATPHDAIFRQLLSQADVARDFLSIHLPKKYLDLCDLTTLTLVSGSFVEEDLRASYSDILYAVQTRHGPGYLYTLIEHQSSPDKLMAFRLMRYALAVMQRHLDAGHDSLPLVIPMLFYHGSVSPWPYSLDWQQLFHDPATARALYSGDFPLVDLTVLPDNQIMAHRRLAMLELLQKHIRRRDLAELQEQLLTLIAGEYLSTQQLGALVRYMLQVGNAADPVALIRALAQHAPQQKEMLMTIAEWLEDQGWKKGHHAGREEQALEIAKRLLKRGLPSELISEVTGLSPQALAQLSH